MTLRNSKKFGFGDYLRQLTIVILGIVITFVGSGLITRCSERKEARTVMQLIVEELNVNSERIKVVGESIKRDKIMAKQLLEADFKCDSFPEDTLNKYGALMGHLLYFSHSRNAMDMFQGSTLMQKMDNKELLVSILQTYDYFDKTQKQTDLYCNTKHKTIFEVIMQLDESGRRIANDTNALNFYKLMTNYTQMRNLCLLAANFDASGFDNAQEDISKLIAEIKNEYDL